MKIDISQIPEHVKQIAARLQKLGHRTWVVGGCTRDLLLGREISDWDLTTTARPETVATAFPKVIPTGIQHGTVTVMMDGEGYEVTTLRGDGDYSDGRRPDAVQFVDSIELDLARRDFTVNAIAADPVTGEITDPWGGLADLKSKILRAVGNPMDRFREDGLRVLRAARFCAVLQFELDAPTSDAIAPNLETFRKVAMERVLAEWVKTLEKGAPPSPAFRIMRYTGILDIVCPPLATLDSIRFAKAIWRLDHTPRDFSLGMAALLLETEESHVAIDKWLRAMKTSNTDRERITGIVAGLRSAPSFSDMVSWNTKENRVHIRKWASRIGRRYLPDALRVYLSNPEGGSIRSSYDLRWAFAGALGHDVPLELKDLAVSGAELQEHLGIPPSRKVGELLKALLDFVLDDPERNTRELLLSYASSLA